MNNPIDELHEKLLKEEIPHVVKQVLSDNSLYPLFDLHGNSEVQQLQCKYIRNQIMYPSDGDLCKFDVICQYGSCYYGDHILESYHELGVDEDGEIRMLTVEEAFNIINNDWRKN